MTTRWYLTNTSAPYTPATVRGTWSKTQAGAVTNYLGLTQSGTATSIRATKTVSTNPYNVLLGRWISDGAVKAGTLSGVCAWVFGCSESSTAANVFTRIHIYVTSGDSDTPRGTIFSNQIGGTEWSTSSVGRGEVDKAITSLAIQAGDRLVIELGTQHQTTSTSTTATLNYGGTVQRDIADSATGGISTTPGWFQLSDPNGLFKDTSWTEENLAFNPFCNTNTSGWDYSGGYGSIAQVSGLSGFSRTVGAQFTATSTAYSTCFPPQMPVTQGEVVSAYIEFSSSVSRTFSVYLNFRDKTNNFLASPNPVNSPTVGTTPTFSKHENYTAPAGAVSVDLTVENANTVNGDVVNVTCLRYDRASSISAYKDGDSSGWAWDGTAEISTSHLAPVTGPSDAQLSGFMPFFV